MSKHTEGPWLGIVDGRYAPTEWTAENDDAQVSTMAPITSATGKTLAIVVSEDWDDSEMDANASLISAAPDLLEALEIMTALTALKYGNLDADVYAEIEKARAAIAKARGEA